MTETPNEVLKNEILDGVALKLKATQSSDVSDESAVTVVPRDDSSDVQISAPNCTYYVREAHKSGEYMNTSPSAGNYAFMSLIYALAPT